MAHLCSRIIILKYDYTASWERYGNDGVPTTPSVRDVRLGHHYRPYKSGQTVLAGAIPPVKVSINVRAGLSSLKNVRADKAVQFFEATGDT